MILQLLFLPVFQPNTPAFMMVDGLKPLCPHYKHVTNTTGQRKTLKNTSPLCAVHFSPRYSQVTLVIEYPFWLLSIYHNKDVHCMYFVYALDTAVYSLKWYAHTWAWPCAWYQFLYKLSSITRVNRLRHYRHLAVVMPDHYQKTANQSMRTIVAKW